MRFLTINFGPRDLQLREVRVPWDSSHETRTDESCESPGLANTGEEVKLVTLVY